MLTGLLSSMDGNPSSRSSSGVRHEEKPVVSRSMLTRLPYRLHAHDGRRKGSLDWRTSAPPARRCGSHSKKLDDSTFRQHGGRSEREGRWPECIVASDWDCTCMYRSLGLPRIHPPLFLCQPLTCHFELSSRRSVHSFMFTSLFRFKAYPADGFVTRRSSNRRLKSAFSTPAKSL